MKTVISGFGRGKQLSEHTASMPAILRFISGEAVLTRGDHAGEARPETWNFMPSDVKHSVQTKRPVVMLLLLLKR